MLRALARAAVVALPSAGFGTDPVRFRCKQARGRLRRLAAWLHPETSALIARVPSAV